MTRLFCLVLAATLASVAPVNAQDKKDPPKDFTNSIGMKFVWIPPGTFMMGSRKEEQERGDNETQHKVTLTKGFYMGVYTVTQEQWQEVMGNNPSLDTDHKKRASFDREDGATRHASESDSGPARTPDGLNARSLCAWSNFEVQDVA